MAIDFYRRWFCKYPGNRWNAKMAHENRTEFFKKEIRMVRENFFLEKVEGKVGCEVGINGGTPVLYEKEGISVTVTEFRWASFDEWEGEPTPKLELKIEMMELGTRKIMFDTWIEIRFENPYPQRAPHVRIMLPKYLNFEGDSHANHLYRNGWVCFYANRKDWNPNQNTVSFIKAVFNWMLWHKKTHGW